jgi:hypothetical protein
MGDKRTGKKKKQIKPVVQDEVATLKPLASVSDQKKKSSK